jgi:hypothetical protein
MNGELTLLNEEYHTKSYTTYEMSQDAANDNEELLADKNALIVEIQKLFESNHELQSQVIEADNAFSAYLEHESRWHYAYWSSGSIRSIVAAKVRQRLLTERIKLLDDWLKREEGDMW